MKNWDRIVDLGVLSRVFHMPKEVEEAVYGSGAGSGAGAGAGAGAGPKEKLTTR